MTKKDVDRKVTKKKLELPKVDAIEPSAVIGKEIDRFVKHIDSLRVSFPATDGVMRLLRGKAQRDVQNFLTKHYPKEYAVGKPSFNLKREHVFRYRELHRRIESAQISLRIVPRSLLVALVSQFDTFLGGLLRVLFYLRPEHLNSSERSLTFSEIVDFGSVDAAREHIIEKEIESVLRKSHSDQFLWLEKKFSITLRKELPAWKDFIEITERRNLFVHANGIVSSQFLKVCREHEVAFETPPKVGEELNVTEEYFKAAYKTIYELGFKLGHVLWRKEHPDGLKSADSNLNDVTYGLLHEGKPHLAANLLDFATEVLKKHSDEEFRLMKVMNRAQAYKWIGNNEKCIHILNAEDWSATSNRFKLSEAVLRDNFSTATVIMEQIGSDGSIKKDEYREWPLFREFRKSNEFLKAFEEIFGEKFQMFVIEEEGITLRIAAEDPPSSSPSSSRMPPVRRAVKKRVIKSGH